MSATGSSVTGTPRRHDMLWLSDEARARILTLLTRNGSVRESRMAEFWAANSLPAIVRRSSPCDGAGIGIGISFPLRDDDGRLRFAAAVVPSDVSALVTPYEVIERSFDADARPLAMLQEVRRVLPVWSGRLGVYGACALQILTRLSYLHDASDLDLVVASGSMDELMSLHKALERLAREYELRADVEVIVDGRFGVKLKELASTQKTFLIKEIHSVGLMDRQDVIRSLSADHAAAL